MCNECREAIKEEIGFLLGILCTPNVKTGVVDLVNEVLEASLVDLYIDDNSDVEESIINVSDMTDLFNNKES